MIQSEEQVENVESSNGSQPEDGLGHKRDLESPYRFSLGAMLLLVVLAAVAFGWWNDRKRLLNRIEALEFEDSPWGTSQVIGPPDTTGFGDIRTAWASGTPDSQNEWLTLEYGKPIRPKTVLVYETYNPGALTQVSVFDPDGKEVVAWRGNDPTTSDKNRGISSIPISTTFEVQYIKLYFDSPNVSGWNEIDAVGLVSDKGITHWATNAAASSSYGKNNRELSPTSQPSLSP
ncbi:MAG: hypothetical protein AAFX06_06240 [Planctomycetota bacterium]